MLLYLRPPFCKPMNWTRTATYLPLVLLAYQLLIDWVPLLPWNDTAAKTTRGRLLEAFVNYSPLLLVSYGFGTGAHRAQLWSLIGSAAYLLGHLNAWWRPY